MTVRLLLQMESSMDNVRPGAQKTATPHSRPDATPGLTKHLVNTGTLYTVDTSIR